MRSSMGAPKNKGYKRSWKNLLLNKRYQLEFTLIMVAVSALMMVGLGWWVMKEADEATEVGKTNALGSECGELPALTEEPATPAPTGAGAADPASADGAAPPVEDVSARRRRATVTLDESTMEMTPEPTPAPTPALAPEPKVSPKFVDLTVAYQACKMGQVAQVKKLDEGRMRILYVLIGVGLLLCVGLAFYGIKMTHKVAGPLYKVTLYFNKMKDGRFDTVYNLRKGDQLVDFYDHFKHAHGGVRGMQQADIERLEALIAAAEAEKLADRSPEVAALLDDLRAMLARKEASLE
jgi:hypothetical protein